VSDLKLRLSRVQLERIVGKDDPDAIRVFERLFELVNTDYNAAHSPPPIGFVYFQGPHDAVPGTLWADSTWEDVTYEEADLVRRCAGALAGTIFSGVPARLTATVVSGVPAISIISGGTGYLSGGSGTIPLAVVGACTTPMVATATVTNGVLTMINVTTPGAGYTSGKLAVYDGVVGHGDLLQGHRHLPLSWPPFIVAQAGSGGTGTGASRVTNATTGDPVTDTGNGNVRLGAETSGAWLSVTKWRRTA